MNKDSYIDHSNSLYPKPDSDEPEDDSWQISYLDIVTIILGFLIIMLSVSQFTKTETFSVSSLFKSDAKEVKFITTPINKIQEELETSLQHELSEGKIEIERDLNDLLIRLNSDSLYLSGSATIQSNALKLLDSISRAIRSNKYNDFNIEVEGHTDDLPIHTQAYGSNWELSTARATNMVKFLSGMGIQDKRLKASGYAASRPIVPNLDDAGNPIPENRAKNRRVTLRLFYDNVVDSTDQVSQNISVQSYDESCRFAVQLGGFENFDNALSRAKEALKNAEMDYQITFNGRLFSVRTLPDANLVETLSNFEILSRDNARNSLGLIEQCYPSFQNPPSPLDLQIQLDTFNSVHKAEDYSNSLQEDYKISTTVTSTAGAHFNVVAQLGNRLKEAFNHTDYIKEVTRKKAAISYQDLKSFPYEFDLRIQIGVFPSVEEATETARDLVPLMGIESTIKRVENGAYLLISESLPDWKSTIQSFSDLSNTSYNFNPVIYLSEQQ